MTVDVKSIEDVCSRVRSRMKDLGYYTYPQGQFVALVAITLEELQKNDDTSNQDLSGPDSET